MAETLPQVIINPTEKELEQLCAISPNLRHWCHLSRKLGRALLLEKSITVKTSESSAENKGYVERAQAETLEALIPITLSLMYGKCVIIDMAVMIDCTVGRSPHLNTEAVCAPYYSHKDIEYVRRYNFKRLMADRSVFQLGLLRMAVKSRGNKKVCIVEVIREENKPIRSSVTPVDCEPNVAARLLCGLDNFESREFILFDCRAAAMLYAADGRPELSLDTITVLDNDKALLQNPAHFALTNLMLQAVYTTFLTHKITKVYCLNICGMWYATYSSKEQVNTALQFIADVCGATVDPKKIVCVTIDIATSSPSTGPCRLQRETQDSTQNGFFSNSAHHLV